MAFGYLNERTKRIINIVLKQSSEITIKALSEDCRVTTRTIYKELEKANEWLDAKNLPKIEVIRGRIQPFSASVKPFFDHAFKSEDNSDDYIFTPNERTKIIICQIILSNEPVYVEDFMRSCFVSRNTIFTDLQVVIAQLQLYQLNLMYEKKSGYRIEGNPIRIRALFFLYFNMLEPVLSAGKLLFLQPQVLEAKVKQLAKVEEALGQHYVYNDMLALAAMLPVMEAGNDKLGFSDTSIQWIQASREHDLVETYFPTLAELEKVYLTLHFLGGRLESYSSQETDEYLMEIAKNLVAEFERIGCVTFCAKEELTQNLYYHIASSIYRYQFGIQIGNPMAEDIKREYPYIFDTMKETVRYLEQQIKVQISDSEIAYLSLHFGAALENANYQEQYLRILVVCINGVATGNMICHELQRILPQAKIVGVMPTSKLNNPQQICDLIISSVKLQTVVPVIVVNPILNDFDRRNILGHPLIRSRFGFVDMDALFQVIKKFVLAEQHAELKKELRKYFIENQKEQQTVLKPDVWRLTDFLTEERIVFLDENGCNMLEKQSYDSKLTVWQRALYTASEPLLKNGSINANYVECMIERLLEAGPYMFVTKDLILAHARPGAGVKHIDISIGIAPQGIAFMDGKVARIVFILVVEDQQKHMGVLQDIRKSLAKKEHVEELMKAAAPAEVCKLISSRLGVE
ncbi:PRD domain-containing protein [[Clostridium] innocuum]|uniref:BglG family transcription antiterminator n=1 Tax=Clostridium innocuum TaxID=1522 RepID=UPI002148AF52|nr:PRD domain-containing protein [[Clostridium] innocuum]